MTDRLATRLGLPAPEGLDGRDLVPRLTRGEPLAESAFFVEHFSVENGANYLVARIAWPHKLLYRSADGATELYDLARDPAERAPLPLDSPVARTLLARTHAYLEAER